jgi:hypothetical protein
MPQKSPSTFSPGQVNPSSSATVTTPPVGAESPLYQYLVKFLGTGQVPLLSETAAALSPVSSGSASSIERVDPIVPSGVTFRPALRFGAPGRAPRLKTRQLWEGTVTELSNTGFAAVLTDKTNPRNPDEQVIFDFDNTEISPEDQKLISPGSSFYWIIGNERTLAGQVKNVSMVQFRRIPAWTERRLATAADRARRIRESFLEQA